MLARGLVRLTASNPGLMTGPGTNTYLVGDGDMAVVDPGPDDAGHLERIVAAARAHRGSVRWVLVTHTHPDHAPGAAALARETGAEVIGNAERDGFQPDVAVGDGWRLSAPSFDLRAVHTPGHASNHLCWLIEDRSVLLSGDHVMHGATVVIRPPDGDMADYLESLERLLAMEPPIAAIAPGHGRFIVAPRQVLEGIVAHRLGRERVVAAALTEAGSATIDELLPRVYADVDPGLLPVARFSLWAHLRKLVADSVAVEVPPEGPEGLGDRGPTATRVHPAGVGGTAPAADSARDTATAPAADSARDSAPEEPALGQRWSMSPGTGRPAS